MPIISVDELDGTTFRGEAHGATISIIFDHSAPGQGPRLHRHPYDETWIVEHGTISFQLGEDRYRARPGDIIVAPPGVAHKFTNDGPQRARLICIHANATTVTEWLE